MAKSKAKKMREKSTREGKRNPELNRSPFIFSDMRMRTTKSKKDNLYRQKHKKNHTFGNGSDGSFFYGL